jgi:Cd2+/Zn2+-exporting ATPase
MIGEKEKSLMKTQQIYIEGLDCPDCAKVLEVDIAKEIGVEKVDLDFLQGRLNIKGDFDLAKVIQRIRNLGFAVKDKRSPVQDSDPPRGLGSLWAYLRSRSELKLVLIGIVFLLLSLLLQYFQISRWVILAVQLVALFIAGLPVFRSAINGLLVNRSLNINFLMSIAAIGAVVIGEPIEAIVMLMLFALSETLEGFTNDKARQVLNEFTELAPQSALLMTESGEKETVVSDIQVGDRILVRAGERFPMDGIVEDGASDVNQAPITGESRLIAKSTGDEVLSGTVNGQSVLTVRITRKAEDTTIQRIIKLVTEAQSVKAKTHKFIDEFAKYYTPAIVILALLVAVVPPLLFNQPFWNLEGERGWLYRALAFLVIGCPCALVISTPVTIISSLIRAARSGIIFKGGIFVEKLARSKAFAFDKTGTLTKGKPVVTQVRALDCSGNENCEACNDMLALACSLEKHSNHPLRAAILTAGKERGVLDRYPAAQNLESLSGRGLTGRVDGRLATIGSLALFRADHNTPPQMVEWVEEAEREGQTTMLICDGKAVRGFISVEDEIRPESASVIRELKDLNIRTIMLTGDNNDVARSVGETLGIDEIHAHLLPQEKLTAIQELTRDCEHVVMIGDGINDSPALAAAEVGVAVGGAGNAQVLETADVVLLGDDLHKLPFAVRLSTFTNRLIMQNIIFSLGVKFIVAGLALAGLTPLWVAVLADMGVSLLVTFNGMRALRFNPKNHPII